MCGWEGNFCRTTVGGLQSQIDEIVRRVLDGRVVRPASSSDNVTTVSHELDRIRRQEMEALLELGLQPCRGLLLYGPPGTKIVLALLEHNSSSLLEISTHST